MGFEDIIDLSDDRTRVRVFSMTAGVLFTVAWWFFIDACAITGLQLEEHPDTLPIKPVVYLPGIGATLVFFIINAMDWTALNADEYSHHGGERTKFQARGILAASMMLGIGSLIGAIVIFADVYASKKGMKDLQPYSSYPGAAVMVQTFLIFVATFVMRFGRRGDDGF